MRKKKKKNYIFHFSSHFLSAHSLSIFIQQVVSSILFANLRLLFVFFTCLRAL